MLRLASSSVSNAERMLAAASSALGGPPGGGPPGGGPFAACASMPEEIAVASSSALSAPLASASISPTALSTPLASRPAVEKAAAISSGAHLPVPVCVEPVDQV